MAFARLRYIALEADGKDAKYPWRVTAWRNVGDIYCNDRFTAGVAEVLIEAWREDGITVELTEIATPAREVSE